MERIPDPSKEALVSPLPCVFQPPGLTVKTNQFEEARNEVRPNLSMRYSLVGSEAHIFSSDYEETDHEIQRLTLKTKLVTGSSSSSFKSKLNSMWEGVISCLKEEERDVNRKKKYAVENDDVSSSSAFESSPLEHRLEYEKNTMKTIQFELKVENTGGEEEDRDGCSQEQMDVSHPDLLSSADIGSNSASSASNDAEESSVQQNQGVNNHGCEGENGENREWWHLPGGEDLPVGERDKDKEDDQTCPQEKMDLDILQHDLLSGCEGENGKKKPRSASNDAEESSLQQNQGVNNHGREGENGENREWWHLPGGEDLLVGDKDEDKKDDQTCPQEKVDLDISQPDLLNSASINNSGASSALRDNSKEDDKEGCRQAKSEVENTGQYHGPSGGVDSSADSAKFAFSPSDLQHSCYCSKPSCGNPNCNDKRKAEVEHMRTHKTHKEWMQCLRCNLTRLVVMKHAKTCCLPGCRIPHCYSIRKVNGDKRNTVAKCKPFKASLVARPSVPEPPMYSKFPQWGSWCNINHADGKVVFRNTDLTVHYFLKSGDYLVDKKLGEGSNGKVYQVHLVSDKSKKMVVKKTTYRKEEVEVYKLLGDHNHIVKHLGVIFSEKEGQACIFMEPCDDSLYDYMENTLKRRLSVAEAMFYWLQIREAVEYLHSLGIIHKDIKAKNVLMKGRRVLLADFDSALRLLNEVTEKGLKRRGTKGFVSPEVWDRAPHGRPVDIFSMGCFLIEMTIGHPVNDTLKEKIEMLRKLDSELAELVEACVSKRPEDRPTARSLLDWSVVKRYLAAGKGDRKENVCHWSQGQETSATEDQTATLHALEYRAGESDVRKICGGEWMEAREL